MSTSTQNKFAAGLTMVAYLLVFFVGLLADCRSLLPLFRHFTHLRMEEWLSMISHIIANIIMAWAMLRMLPTKYRVNGFKSFLYFFLLGLFIPIVGNLGLAAVLILGIKREKSIAFRDEPIQYTAQLPMPANPSTILSKPKFSTHGMQSRLQRSDNTEEHLRIVLATRFMSNNHAIPLLKMALRNSEDEVRLLAFSMLEGKNTEIYNRIEKLKKCLDSVEQKENIYISIARNYLSLVKLNLTQKEMKSKILAKAHQYLQMALVDDPDNRNVYFTLGQVLLESGVIEEASHSFTKALELGFPPSAVNPFLAEISFKQRRFRKITHYIQQIPVRRRVYPPLADIAAYWL